MAWIMNYVDGVCSRVASSKDWTAKTKGTIQPPNTKQRGLRRKRREEHVKNGMTLLMDEQVR
jgi:hypothetical protein